MDTLLILRQVRIENANAISGLTWGFPAMSHFLGYMHALQRKLPATIPWELTSCGVVCHQHAVQAHCLGGSDYVFALTRNPLTSEEKTAAFNQEGRVHLTVTLVISCQGRISRDLSIEDQQAILRELALSQRLAGGTIIDIGEVILVTAPEGEEKRDRFQRKWLRKLLPGFALIQRSDVLSLQLKEMREKTPNADLLDAWLAFSSIRYESKQGNGETPQTNENDDELWERVPRADEGWLVPITIGYRAISEVYPPGQVKHARDNTVPFRFVESAYTIGQWVSPHRLKSLDDLMWRYKAEAENGWYLFSNDNFLHNTAV